MRVGEHFAVPVDAELGGQPLQLVADRVGDRAVQDLAVRAEGAAQPAGGDPHPVHGVRRRPGARRGRARRSRRSGGVRSPGRASPAVAGLAAACSRRLRAGLCAGVRSAVSRAAARASLEGRSERRSPASRSRCSTASSSAGSPPSASSTSTSVHSPVAGGRGQPLGGDRVGGQLGEQRAVARPRDGGRRRSESRWTSGHQAGVADPGADEPGEVARAAVAPSGALDLVA